MIMKSMWWASALSAVLATTVSAQTTTTRTDQLSATTRIVVGGTAFDQVLKVIGLPSVSGGATSAIGIDSSGNVRKDAGTTTDTSGHVFFSNWVYGPFTVATSTGADAALGFDNVRIHQNAGTPRLTFEDNGFSQWTADNSSGSLRFYRTNSSGVAETVPLILTDLITVDPKGKAILPNLPYDINLGSPIKKFLAIYAAELNVETLVRQNIMATMGGRLLILPTAALLADITSTQTTISLTTNNFASGDRGYMEGDGRVEFLAFTSGATLLNLCPQSGSCATADTSTNWSLSSGSITVDRDHRWQGDASLSAPNTTTFIGYNDGTSFLTNSVTYTVQAVVRRSDDGVITPGASYKVFCGASDSATTTVADDLGTNGLGHHWYRLHGSCTHTSGTGWAGVTNLPTGGVTHNIDAVQIEIGSTMTPWSQTAASYSVTRNLDGSGGNAWVAGTAVANTGQTGNGFIDEYSTRGVRAGTEIGPTIAFNKRNSSTYNDWTTCGAIGQLNGLFGYSSSTFGAGFGCNGGTWLTITSADGIKFWNGSTLKADFDLSGNITLGGHVANTPVMLLTPTALQFCIYGGACTFTVDGTTGDMRGGSATALNTGTGYFIGGTGTARFGNPSADFWKWDGTNLTVTSLNLSIGSTGTIMSPASSCCLDVNGYSFKRLSGNNTNFGTNAWDDGTASQIAVYNILNNGAKSVEVSIGAGNNNAVRSVIHVHSGATFGSEGISMVVAAGGALTFNGNAGLTTTVVVPCGTLSFTLGSLTNKGAC